MNKDLEKEIKLLAERFSKRADKSPENVLIVRTLLTLARVLELGIANQIDCCFVLKHYISKKKSES